MDEPGLVGQTATYPLRGLERDPQTLNLYAYVRKNPLSRRDLDGHEGSALDRLKAWFCALVEPGIEPQAPSPSMRRYNSRVRSAFPTTDINKLIPNDAEARRLLHGRIEMYLSGIAGYASSADRLKRRPEQDLRTARQVLSGSFFDKFPEYAPTERKSLQETRRRSFVKWKPQN